MVVELRDVTKKYGDLVAVDSLSLDIYAGEVFALLGPNGAGKTTTIRMICGLLRPTRGTIRVFGEPIPEHALKVRRRIGLLPQESDVYVYLTGRENLEYFARLYGLSPQEARERAEWALELVGLSERADDLAGSYSGGMKRRLMVARAIVHDPDLVILDEPTAGLDVLAARRIHNLVREIAKKGKTVILTTNALEDVEKTADRIALLDRGKLIVVGDKEALKRKFGEKSLEGLFIKLIEGED